jgi:hypothetical protein
LRFADASFAHCLRWICALAFQRKSSIERHGYPKDVPI